MMQTFDNDDHGDLDIKQDADAQREAQQDKPVLTNRTREEDVGPVGLTFPFPLCAGRDLQAGADSDSKQTA